MRKPTKAELEKKKTQVRASRMSLLILLVIEAFILLMHFPGFLGAEWIETGLVTVRTFLVDFLWPADTADMVTYKGTIYEICTWFQSLPIFGLLVQVIIYLVPGLFVLSFIRIRILDWRISQMDRPAKPAGSEQSKESKKPKPPQEHGLMGFRGVDIIKDQGAIAASEAREANEYCKWHQDLCDDPFSAEPGLRIQLLTGEPETGGSRDMVKSWDDNGVIDLSPLLKRPVKVVLENGLPYMYTKDDRGCIQKANVPLERYDPVGDIVPVDGGKFVVCVITWLGGQ